MNTEEEIEIPGLKISVEDPKLRIAIRSFAASAGQSFQMIGNLALREGLEVLKKKREATLHGSGKKGTAAADGGRGDGKGGV